MLLATPPVCSPLLYFEHFLQPQRIGFGSEAANSGLNTVEVPTAGGSARVDKKAINEQRHEVSSFFLMC